MKYTKQERLDIGRRIYTKEITYRKAMEIYELSETSVHKYLADYKKANNFPLNKLSGISGPSEPKDIEAYMAMSKEELIRELILAKANELRAKKGYEVKGVGANKEFIPLNRPNSRS